MSLLYRYGLLVLLLMPLAGLVGNGMVIMAVRLVGKLRCDTNTVLSSLATADFLVCVLVMPPAVVQLIIGKTSHVH